MTIANGEIIQSDDIWNLDIDKLPSFNVLLGGFPCQPFSVAGYMKGFKDEKGRGNLFFRINNSGYFHESTKFWSPEDNPNRFILWSYLGDI